MASAHSPHCFTPSFWAPQGKRDFGLAQQRSFLPPDFGMEPPRAEAVYPNGLRPSRWGCWRLRRLLAGHCRRRRLRPAGLPRRPFQAAPRQGGRWPAAGDAAALPGGGPADACLPACPPAARAESAGAEAEAEPAAARAGQAGQGRSERREDGPRRPAAARRARSMGPLHCTREPVPEAVGADMQQLNQLSAQQFSALTEALFQFLREPKEVERFLTRLSEFAATNKVSLGPLKNIVKSLLLVPSGESEHPSGLSEEKASYFEEQWKENSPTLSRLAVGQTLIVNQLIDMEWKFGVTAGSSELKKVGSIFLQLKLMVKSGNQIEPVYIELTLPQFYSFLHEMERVKTSLECLS
ncbi:hypothetical protein lerEdw1_004633 [Lerista edwardsae]|nr:hypothetical protein lerEdw1_004633 [Lerista edwardsae]